MLPPGTARVAVERSGSFELDIRVRLFKQEVVKNSGVEIVQ